MKKIISTVVTILVLGIVFIIIMYPKEVNLQIENSTKSNSAFSVMIDTIEKKVVDLTSTFDLLEVSEFKQVSAFSSDYFQDAISFLSDSTKNETQKTIVILAMQSLDKKDYFNFLNACAELYQAGKLTENTILYVLLPGTSWNNRVILNFYRPVVRKPLKKIRSTNNISPHLKETIKEILSGKLMLDNFLGLPPT